MTASLTVLGCAGTHPGPGRMCSSYLLEADGYRLLLDCGNGSLGNLQQRCDIGDIDALLISHLHHDHFADLYGLYYALRFHPDGPRDLTIYGPRGLREFVTQLLPPESAATFAQRCRAQVAAAGDVLELGPLRVELHAVNHPLETLGSRIQVGDRLLAYTADTAPAPSVDGLAADVDLLVCDATWLDRAGPYPDGVHMTGVQAGQTAARAGAARLLVTHVLGSLDPAQVGAEAAAVYEGETLVAHDLLEIAL